MGPLYSFALILIVTVALGAAVFTTARVFHLTHPFLIALAFPVGAVVGGGVSVLLAALVIGVGPALNGQQALGYLAFLGFGALASGALFVWCCKCFLTFNSTGRAMRAG
ncbi:hypothetical protein GJ699_31870 [Duganella sp. FT80W]|uniref:Uncharacterized protein n=1 Tax=Duganella guangzhouensis TaxID=2666084 RepID=A0A6I2L8K2_9BURK|nr:hypothetical protein [Duganella guangzhouensis]MRW94575.1 hypothetical protein [Duganella guangzhouensis]